MTDGGQENAMTEIALAMAMGFFSIMVLTALSMGVSRAARVDTTILAPSASDSAAAETLDADDILIVFDGKTYYDRRLRPIDPASLAPERRRVLAVPPALSMADAVAARQPLVGGPIVITTLNADWQRALQERRHGR